MNIATILEEQARRSPDRAAIVEARRAITFSELDRAAAQAAADLAGAGVRPGMRVLVVSQMSIALYTTMIGLFRIRAVAVFVDPSAGRARLNSCVARVQPGAFVAIPRAHLLRLLSPAIRAIPVKATIGGWIPGASRIGRHRVDRGAAVQPCDPDAPAVITFTSGSTGEPKAAVRTHGFLIAQHRALVDSIALEAGEVDLCTLPIFLLANLASGVTSVIPDADLRAPGAIDPAPVQAQMQAAEVTRTVASPAFLTRLAAHARETGRPLTTLRRVYTGGAPVFPAMLDAIAAAAPQATVVAVYGSTEAEPIAEIDRRDISTHDRDAMLRGGGLLTGLPTAAIALRILPDRWGTPVGPLTDADLDRQRLAAGELGEIVVTGDHVLTGYLDGYGDDETKIKVGDRVWHRTGDAGYLDPQGRLWLLGRCSAKASDDRGVLYPFAVEAAASEVDGVRRTAFVLHRGRRILVAETLRLAEARSRQADGARICDELRRRLSWAHLADVIIVPRIPVDRRHNAKVEYPELLRLLDRQST